MLCLEFKPIALVCHINKSYVLFLVENRYGQMGVDCGAIQWMGLVQRGTREVG